MPLAPRLTDLVAIVVIDPTAMFAYDDTRLVLYDSLMKSTLDEVALLARLEQRAGRIH